MKMKIKSFLMLALFAVFAVSCSQSDDLLVPEEAPQTRAYSAMLITTPEMLYFNVPVGQSDEKNVNVKTAGLSSMALLTNFTVTVQGPDADQFIADDPSLSLGALLQALLGNGVNIPVTYFPTEQGPHEAELLITASLLGVLMPVQKSVPLHGTTIPLPGPVVTSSVPTNGGSTTFDSRVPNVEGEPLGQYHIDITFDQNVTIGPNFDAEFQNTTGADIKNVQVINNNTVRLTIWEESLSASLPHYLVIYAGSVVGSNNVANTEDINFNYTVTGGIPN